MVYELGTPPIVIIWYSNGTLPIKLINPGLTFTLNRRLWLTAGLLIHQSRSVGLSSKNILQAYHHHISRYPSTPAFLLVKAPLWKKITIVSPLWLSSFFWNPTTLTLGGTKSLTQKAELSCLRNSTTEASEGLWKQVPRGCGTPVMG